MDESIVTPEAFAQRLNLAEAKAIFIRWEKLRLIYNGVIGLILLVAFLVYALPDQPPMSVWLGYIGLCAVGGVIANACYFAGPLADLYFAWLGWRTPWTTALLFVSGLLVTCGLAVLWFVFLGISVFMFFR